MKIDGKVGVIIVDDHKLIRKAWRSLFSLDTDYHVIADLQNGKELLDYLKYKEADVILMDINMPEIDGIEATKIIKSQYPKIKVIALSMHKENIYVKKMLDAGADGYIDKDSSPLELFIAIDEVLDNTKYISAKIRLENKVAFLNNGLVSDYSAKAKPKPKESYD